MIKRSIGYVYLINQDDTDIYKIGVSKNEPSLRLKNLQTGNDKQLSIIFYLKSNCYTTLESTLHKTFQYDNIKGEWFKFANKDVIITEMQSVNSRLETLLENSTLL